jgi:DNA-directed RNA polymerase III subunit RPC1
MLDEKAKRGFLKRVRNPNLDSIQRKDIFKAINTACKKVTTCPYCQALNGTIKKVGALKLIHEKFKKKKTLQEEEFKASFQIAAELDPTLKHHISKAQEDLNPLVVLRLFQAIEDEDVELLGLDLEKGRPELFIWNALPVPPVCARPSVGQENARFASRKLIHK